MSKDKLPPLDLNYEDIRAGLENDRYHNGNVADALSCRERQLSDALDRIAALEMERDALKMWIRERSFAPHRGEKVQQLLSHPPEYWAEKAKEWR